MLNGDISTDFEVDEKSQSTLSIINKGEKNRLKITAQDINKTGFVAKLDHVQYGQWKGEEAVLVRLSFHFHFPNESSKRLTAATIRITLEETKDATFTEVSPRNPMNDPQIVLLAPVQVCGELTKESRGFDWRLNVPVKLNVLGAEVGVEAEAGVTAEKSLDHRMWIKGFTNSDDLHHEDNEAVWEIQENKAQESGILHHFPAALVFRLPPNPKHPVKLRGKVIPSIAFSLNPLRLVQKRDDAVFLDRVTSKPEEQKPFAPELDFSDPDFPWDEVVKIPSEYTVCELESILETELTLF